MHASIADVIADTAQNSIEAGATRIKVTMKESGATLAVTISDNGKGMDAEVQKRVFDPFYTEAGKHDKRKVGLGLPILKQICEECEGGLELHSVKGEGTTLCYHFNAKHIDLPPIGDIASMVVTLFNYPGEFELEWTHQRNDAEYTIARSELIDAVGSLETIDGIALAREFLNGQEEALKDDDIGN